MIKITKRNPVFFIIIIAVLIIAVLLFSNWSVIFQRGNPVPYLKSILKLSDDQTYIKVQDDNSNLFITKRNQYDEFHEYISDYYGVSFEEQMGSAYIFRSDEKVVTVTSQIYWKYFAVHNVFLAPAASQ